MRDLLTEAAAGMLQRPARSVLTALGTVLGVGTFVAVLGLTATATGQIDERFNELTATEIGVDDTGGTNAAMLPLAFTPDADARVRALNGVTGAGVYWPVRLPTGATVRAAPVGRDAGGQPVQVVGASAGLLPAAGATFAEGRAWDTFHDSRAEQVAVIGEGTAARLGITTLETQPAVFIGDVPFTVVGILADTERKADLLLSVLIPRTTAEKIWGPPEDGKRAAMLVTTELGAARQVADEAPYALRPDHPDYFTTIPPPDPRTLRDNVTSDLGTLFLLLAGICLVIGAVGIANTTLVAVMERTGEIGLRRALGARGRHIAGQFLAESAALGALGGLVGTSLGTIAVVTTSAARAWTPVVHPATVAAAPAIGLLTGLLAGLYPSWRASRIEPVEALRR
ncbi:ABC transporter permease [Yinghuangia seranimata]|uniref:ABC transporter permease n=1 Tax=Yinghuangia seranimata TaxID=408067 RepID=UPI00248C9742|nr:ABC transporter permease [Yinghuangia seranimata]MDI2129207.1 ABC transporter permease [Yinghuangia seranimata]